MIIQWLGKSCFKIQTKNQAGDITIVIDPFTDDSSLKMPRIGADLVMVSNNNEDHNNVEAIRGESFVVNQPGEYEIKNVFIYGVPAVMAAEKSKSILFRIISEDVSIVHLSNLSQPLTVEQIDRLGNVDVLLIPVGGVNSLDGKKAAEVISQIDPRLVVPMMYNAEGQKTDLKTVDEFLRNCGLKSDKIDKLKLAKKDLMAEETRVAVLSI